MQIKNYIETLVKNAQLRLEPKLLRIFGETSLLFTWARRLLLYFAFYVGIISSHLYFKRFDWWHTDIERTRALLGALVTSEAAILAIVVSLSLVAVQLAASSYSARVIEVFRKAPDLWILIGVYGVSMFYGLWALNQTNSLEAHIAFSYYLGVFAFVAIGVYIWKTLEMLKPSTVINILAERITKQSLVSATKEEVEIITDGLSSFHFSGRGSAEEGPLLPIIDILHSSMMKYDYETLRIGLRTIKNRINHIFNNETFNLDEEIKISSYIFDNLTRVGELAASRKDEHSILELIINLQKIGINVAMKKREYATFLSVISLSKIGKIAAELKFENATRNIVQSLDDIGKIAPTIDAIRALENVGIAAAERRLDAATLVIWALEALLEIAKAKNLVKATQQIEESLKKVNEAISKFEKEQRWGIKYRNALRTQRIRILLRPLKKRLFSTVIYGMRRD